MTVDEILERYHFDRELHERLRVRVADGSLSPESNVVRGEIEPLEVVPLDSGAEREGKAAIERGEVAVAILNGGMATRFGGLVKGIVEAHGGRSFLEWKLLDAERWNAPAVVMTSFATDAATRDFVTGCSLDEPVFFAQSVSLRLNPDGSLFEEDGEPSPYSPGHGDFADSIRRTGTLDALRERGIRYVALSNVDNLGARLDPRVIGAHIASGALMTSEAVRKEPGDVGGAPVRVDGRPMVVEGLRFPPGLDHESMPVFNTNTFVFGVEALAEPWPLTWLYVEKEVDGRTAVQLETLVNELSAFVPTNYVEVPRTGPERRFLPIKEPEDLAAAQDALAEMLQS